MGPLRDFLARSPRRTLAVLGVAGAVLAGALYGTLGSGGNSAGATCAASQEAAARIRPLARGEMAALAVASEPAPLPAIAFEDPDGKRVTLADFKGKTLVVNLWATWCAPCRKEMPALDQLQAREGSGTFEVVAINLDTRNLDKPREWLKETGADRLAYYSDRDAKVFQTLRSAGKAVGMPTTYLVDPNGCALAVLNGAAEWASDDAIAVVRAARAS